MATVLCRGCNRRFRALGVHLGKKPECRKAYVDDYCLDCPDNEQAKARVEADHYHRCRLREVFKLVAELFWFRYVSSTILDVFRRAIAIWVTFAVHSMKPQLDDIVGDAEKVKQITDLMKDRLDFLRGLETEQRLKAYARAHFDTLQPIQVPVGLGDDDRSYNIMIYQWVTLLMQHHDKARAEIVASSDLMKSGDLLKEPEVISSWMHGSVFREHAFAQPETGLSEGGLPIVRVIIVVGHDGLELRNPLGQQHGEHNIAGIYGAIGNLPAAMRYQHDFMAPLQVVNEKVLHRCNPIRVFAGADPQTGELLPEDYSSIGAQSRTQCFVTRVCLASLCLRTMKPT